LQSAAEYYILPRFNFQNQEDIVMTDLIWAIVIVAVGGGLGGFANVFIGDSGLHLPKTENGLFEPGFLGTVLVGALAALGSWCAAKTTVIFGGPSTVTFSTGDIANALMLGFGGAKWFKSEGEKDVLQQAAGIAANKQADPIAAAKIATMNPIEALKEAQNMKG
jgi:hypothetical protein